MHKKHLGKFENLFVIFTKKAVNKLGIYGDFLSLMKISTKYL